MKCLHLSCELEAWAEGTERSHWCLEHAWRYVRGDIVTNEAQRAELAKWPDDLKYRYSFPLEYTDERKRRDKRLQFKDWQYNSCWHCGQPIVSSARFCGRCRLARGLPEDETDIPSIQCSNWGPAGPGHYLNSECQNRFPSYTAFRPKGTTRVFCPPCMARLTGMGEEWRKIYGYDF